MLVLELLVDLVDGKKLFLGEWNYTEAKNVGKVNATTAMKTQADAEALAQWTKNVEKDSEDILKD